MLQQHQQNLKRLFLQANAPFALAQFARADVEFKLTEADLLYGNMTLPVTNGYNLSQPHVSAISRVFPNKRTNGESQPPILPQNRPVHSITANKSIA
jgi:hypothetical protein